MKGSAANVGQGCRADAATATSLT